MICSTGTAFAAVTDGLVGVAPGSPQIDSQGVLGLQCSYDSGTQTLTIESTPNLYFPDPFTLDNINSGTLVLTATIDNAGNLVSGTLTINGTTVSGLTDPLLTGNLTALGLEDTSPIPGTDQGDFRVTPTGGSVFTGPDWPAGFSATGSFSLRLSTYSGTFASDWNCSTANAGTGAEFFPPPAIDISDYIGQQQATAEANIIADGLSVGVVTMQVDAAAAGTVIGQNPTTCTNCASLLDPVDLTVSTGPTPTEIEVGIIVKPGSDPNCFNINGNGTVPVAILGDTVDITMVDHSSLTFQGLERSPRDCTISDINNDAVDDLQCEFLDDLDNWIPPANEDLGTLLGQLLDGTLIIGTDGICLITNSSSSAINPGIIALLSLIALMRRRVRTS